MGRSLKSIKKGCGEPCFYDGCKTYKCGEVYLDKTNKQRMYCDLCWLKNKGIKEGSKFYLITYCCGRWEHQYEIVKINGSSVRIKTTFLDGRQTPDTWSVPFDKFFNKLHKWSKTYEESLDKSIDNQKFAIKGFRKQIKIIPRQIEVIKKEIVELRKKKSALYSASINKGDKNE